MPFEFIRVEKKDHLTIITIDREEVLNALHPPACHEMEKAFDDFCNDPDAWVSIIRGAGDQAFCTGNDMKWMTQHGREALRNGLDSLKSGWGGLTRRFDCYKPIIAAVNGFALGGGFELALACDIILASENAFFGFPEPRVGNMASEGGVNRLSIQIPYHVAMGFILTGRRISAQEAYRLGIANEIVPGNELMGTAERWAADIMECSPLAVRAAKEAVLNGFHLPFREVIGKRFSEHSALLKSEDYMEGSQAFAEKRRPKWRNK